jgi:hypothetical protein
LRIEDFLYSVRLFLWARDELSFPLHPHTEIVAVKAARGSHLEVLEWLRDKTGAWTAAVCESAASAGHVHVLEWLRSRKPPCPWGGGSCIDAAKNGHLGALQWLQAQVPPCPSPIFPSFMFLATVMAGHLNVFQYLHSQNPFDNTVSHCAIAAEHGHLEMLQWMRAQDPPIPWSELTCEGAARGGHLHILQWLRAQTPPCPWDARACSYSARRGHLEVVLQWLRAQNPPCPRRGALEAAVERGHLEIERWLREEDTWDENNWVDDPGEVDSDEEGM